MSNFIDEDDIGDFEQDEAIEKMAVTMGPLNPHEPQKDVPREPLKEEAKRTSKTVQENMDGMEKQHSNIQKIVDLLREQERDDPVTPSPLPDQREVEFDDKYTECIISALEIINQYHDNDTIDMHKAHADATDLQGYLVSLAPHLAFCQARYAHLERSLDVIRAKNFLRAKNIAQSHRIKITDVEAKEFAKAQSAKHIADIGAAETYWRYVYNIYMSILSFVEVLDHSASREFKVNFDSSRQR